MNWNDLDKLFRDKLRPRQASFDEQSWDAMEALLNKRERRRRWLRLLPLLPLLLLLAGGGYWYAYQGPLAGEGSAVRATSPSNANSAKRTQADSGGFSPAPLLTLRHSPKVAATPGAPGGDSSSSGSAGSPATASVNTVNGSYDGEPQSPAQSNRNQYTGVANPDKGRKSATNAESASVTVASAKKEAESRGLSKKPLKLTELAGGRINPEQADAWGDSLNVEEPAIPESFEVGLAGGAALRNAADPGNTSWSPAPLAGIYLRWHLGDQLFLNGELLYQYNPSPAYTATISQRSYGFGFEQVKTALSLTETHTLQLPVYLEYELLGAHGILGGLQGSYRLAARGALTTTRSSSLSSPSSNARSTWVAPKGLDPLQAGAMLGYRYDYSDQLRLQLRGTIQLTGSQPQETESATSPAGNTGIQLMLQYQLN